MLLIFHYKTRVNETAFCGDKLPFDNDIFACYSCGLLGIEEY